MKPVSWKGKMVGVKQTEEVGRNIEKKSFKRNEWMKEDMDSGVAVSRDVGVDFSVGQSGEGVPDIPQLLPTVPNSKAGIGFHLTPNHLI